DRRHRGSDGDADREAGRGRRQPESDAGQDVEAGLAVRPVLQEPYGLEAERAEGGQCAAEAGPEQGDDRPRQGMGGARQQPEAATADEVDGEGSPGEDAFTTPLDVTVEQVAAGRADGAADQDEENDHGFSGAVPRPTYRYTSTWSSMTRPSSMRSSSSR